jgi:hypothetical protein
MPDLARPVRSAAVRSVSEPSPAHDAELGHLRQAGGFGPGPDGFSAESTSNGVV